MTVSEIREHYPVFTYTSAEWKIEGESLVCSYIYSVGDLQFSHQVTFPVAPDNNPDEAVLNQLVINLGMVEAISYWKLTCSPTISVEAFSLSPQQRDWWKSLILNGMGEYFYVNDIDFSEPEFLTIATQSDSPSPPVTIHSNQNEQPRLLIPVGGGKDSIVTLELLKQHFSDQDQKQLGILLVNPSQAAKDVSKTSDLHDILTVQRTFDPQLFKLNQHGFLNGHVPISATFAWISVIVAYLHGYDLIAISNERSSNEGNVVFHDTEINHQWSKSFAFEEMFQKYVAQISPNLPKYFSLLRPLYELQIAKLFTKNAAQYFEVFRSCNRGSKQNTWCGECSKCLFAYIILLPVLGIEKTVAIFGKDLLADKNLLTTALELIGQGQNKPLDCVGMYEESLVALLNCSHRYQQESIPLPFLLTALESHYSTQTVLDSQPQFLRGWNEQHAIPESLAELLPTLRRSFS